ncbi:hypothetical protein F503_00599 [Ophiostoma piceae UAMH 11346]|uniref:Uncharacterized protein n=1 Tax=Ophiostoma piceae (strain UAMH 11346) TaxID=1262450 RepID=S3C506_OPHP1|nr:hypothetical protein F503_00599 [Ophiostoma piceae UAMH 11346]
MAATPFDATAAADLGFDFFIYDEERQQQQQQQQLQQPLYTQQQPPPPQYTQYQPTTTQYTQPPPQQQLPTGRCNYVDLTHGSGAAQCGCRRFWGRAPSTPTATTPTVHQQFGLLTSSVMPTADPGYCMCSHHACFHDHDQAQTQPPNSVNTSFFNITSMPLAEVPIADTQTGGQENEKPRTALSPVQLDERLQLERLQQLEAGLELEQLQQLEIPEEHSIPDTLSWGELQLDLPTQPNSNSLANSISHPPLSQKASSTTSSRYMRPFAGRGLDTLPEGRPAEAAQSFSTALVPASKALSVTGSIISTTSNTTTTPVSQTLRAHDARLERLENPSFFASTNSQAINNLKEDYLERHDQVDLRVTELESRMEDVERRIADEGSIREAPTELTASASTASTVSIATARSASPDSSLLRQLHTLQQEVALLRQEAQLAASTPSVQKPWLLEVVFMPFPLKGLWVEASQFATAAAVAAASAAKRRQELFSRDFLFGAPEEWTCESSGSRKSEEKNVPRLLPRACAPGRLIDRRLRSRGLVQTVTVKGGDARAVEAAVAEAFSLAAPKAAATSQDTDAMAASTSLGLQHPWVPLRKVHKDSRLRFLTRTEMATPALWTPAFLKESVVMKVGQGSHGTESDKSDSGDRKHRLYITQPGAYTQDRQAHAAGWSWDQLRGAEAVGQEGKDETVWEWNSRLDEAPVDTQSSESSESTDTTDTTEEVIQNPQSPDDVPDDVLVDVVLEAAPMPTAPITAATHASSRSPSSSQFFTVNQSPARPVSALTSSRSMSSHRLSSARRSMSPFFVSAVQSSGMQSRTASRPAPIRTTSARTSASVSMSRVAKRRSPSVGFAGNFWPRNTPRYSRSPSAAPPSARVRGTTPFCYATPYSNAYGDDDREHERQQDDEVHRRRTYPGYGFNGGFNNGMGLDDAMDVMGYGSDDYDEVDFDNLDDDDDGVGGVEIDGDDDDIPMTQDGDDIEVYEDQDDAHLRGKEKPLLPEDEPWPGIDSNYEGDSGGYDGSGSSQGSQGSQGSQVDGSQVVDEDDEMSDENLDPEQSLISHVSQQASQHQDTFGQLNQFNRLTGLTGLTGPTEPTEPATFRAHHPGQHHLDSDSSQPSEYPSTRRPRRRQPQPHQLLAAGHNHAAGQTQQFDMYGPDEGIGFKIHEDEA